jgi:hypothetical protein
VFGRQVRVAQRHRDIAVAEQLAHGVQVDSVLHKP